MLPLKDKKQQLWILYERYLLSGYKRRARHVTFSVNYLEEFVATLSDKERDRAEFAYEACVVMRNRFGSDNVMKHYGWNVEEAQEVSINLRMRALQ